MRIGGLHKFSLIDYPGKMAAVVFTQGCNLRCGYCHNPELVCPQLFHAPLDVEEFMAFLRKRVHQLEGVVVTGGEPTIHQDLPEFLADIKSLGYAVKLDTNGTNPRMIKRLLDGKLLDYLAMDIKGPLSEYRKIVGKDIDLEDVRATIDLIVTSGLPYQFRSTLLKPFLPPLGMEQMVALVKEAEHYVLQEFIPSDKILDKALLDHVQFSRPELDALRARWERLPGTAAHVLNPA